MEVKPGYKQTEVGVIPEEWDLTPLVELIDASRSIRYGIVQPGKFDPSGRYMVRGQDYSTGWVDPSELFRVTPQVEEPFKNARLKAGDVIITIVGASTGHIEVIPDWLDGANLTQTTARLAINPSKAFSGFCKCYLQSSAGQRQVASYLKGAAQPGLNCGDIEKFKIPLPPALPEQRAIATALSDVDGLLGGLDRLIAKKRDLKQAAMQQLLTGQTRLPGFAPACENFKQTDVGVIPEDWQPEFIENFAAITTGSKNTQDRIEDGQYPFFVRSQTVERINSYSFDGEAVLTAGDGVGTGKVFHYIKGKFDVHQRVYRISHFAESVNGYFFYLYFSNNFYGRIMQMTAKSSVDSVRRDMIARMLVPLPPTKAEQTAIAEVLTEMDGELAVLEQRRVKTRALKQAMMQELLTGRTRLV